MGIITRALRENIARNIRELRMQRFPGRGGGKQCAKAFGVLPQQWCPWERGQRTPCERHLERIAEFFRRYHRTPDRRRQIAGEWARRDAG